MSPGPEMQRSGFDPARYPINPGYQYADPTPYKNKEKDPDELQLFYEELEKAPFSNENNYVFKWNSKLKKYTCQDTDYLLRHPDVNPQKFNAFLEDLMTQKKLIPELNFDFVGIITLFIGLMIACLAGIIFFLKITILGIIFMIIAGVCLIVGASFFLISRKAQNTHLKQRRSELRNYLDGINMKHFSVDGQHFTASPRLSYIIFRLFPLSNQMYNSNQTVDWPVGRLMDESTMMPLQQQAYMSPNRKNFPSPRMPNQRPQQEAGYDNRNLTPRRLNQPDYRDYDEQMYPDQNWPNQVMPYQKSYKPDLNDENTTRNRPQNYGSGSGKKPKIKLSNKKKEQYKDFAPDQQKSNQSKMTKPKKNMDLSKPQEKSNYADYFEDTPTETKQYNRPTVYTQPTQTIYYPAVQQNPQRYISSGYDSPVVYRATPTPERTVIIQADPKPFLPTQTIVRRAPLQEIQPVTQIYNQGAFPETNFNLQISHDPDEEIDIELVAKEANIPIRFKINPTSQKPSDQFAGPRYSSRGFSSGQTPFR